jgi:hypothetical protein
MPFIAYFSHNHQVTSVKMPVKSLNASQTIVRQKNRISTGYMQSIFQKKIDVANNLLNVLLSEFQI